MEGHNGGLQACGWRGQRGGVGGYCTIIRKEELRGGKFGEGLREQPAVEDRQDRLVPHQRGLLLGSPGQAGWGLQVGAPTLLTCVLRRGGCSKVPLSMKLVRSLEGRLLPDMQERNQFCVVPGL